MGGPVGFLNKLNNYHSYNYNYLYIRRVCLCYASLRIENVKIRLPEGEELNSNY